MDKRTDDLYGPIRRKFVVFVNNCRVSDIALKATFPNERFFMAIEILRINQSHGINCSPKTLVILSDDTKIDPCADRTVVRHGWTRDTSIRQACFCSDVGNCCALLGCFFVHLHCSSAVRGIDGHTSIPNTFTTQCRSAGKERLSGSEEVTRFLCTLGRSFMELIPIHRKKCHSDVI